ncbi:DNA polymerase III, subunit gamma and tau [Candidatus Uhrbacteria bacterium RIFCSPHIGHO2_01_FULL_63_20]|uniref:DNA polymerase III subunit gamma/tau n=1 Tax=Candidatus Uhrbacteria bacterium RIFCSPHIGHO2_01_FULL_63_20 TaxID=1802385 RepID=A0A1F7TKM0_9BACT|nr:MAG: DNA polymerase III, subunit gamma and tau [Candidatus Uhrbacteria bacterium RIFCSPHIGHO2_01_FULL_63_20]
MAEALYRKYRPVSFSDVVGQEHVKTTLKNEVASGTIAHSYLFTGPRGVGKTTVARILAKAVNCLKNGVGPSSAPEGASAGGEPCNACEACEAIAAGNALDVVELDAATHTGVDNIRETVIEAVRFAPNRLKHRVYVIDEVHMLSAGSFNALLKTLEEPPAHAVFVLATTEVHKVPATVVSRCQRFDFRRIGVADLVETLRDICKKEGREVDDAVLAEVARHADGGLRDAESLLGQLLAVGGKKVTADEAALVLPSTNALAAAELVEHLVKQDAASAVRLVNRCAEQGVDMPHFAADLVDALRAMLHASLGDAEALSMKLERSAAERLTALLGQTSPKALSAMTERFLEAKRHSKGDAIPQLPLELAIVESCIPANPAHPFEQPGVDSGPPLAETVAIETTALGDVPVLDLDEVKSRWPEVFQLVKAANASLPVVLKTGEVKGVDGNRIELSFAYALHAETVNNDRNRRILEPVLHKVYGRRIHVHGTYAASDGDDAVDALLEEFGGTAA